MHADNNVHADVNNSLHPNNSLTYYACRYGDGTFRITVEQDVIFPNIPEDKLDAMQQEAIFEKYAFSYQHQHQFYAADPSCTKSGVVTSGFAMACQSAVHAALSMMLVAGLITWLTV